MAKELSDKEKLEQVLGIHDSDEIDTYNEWTEDKARAIAKTMDIDLTDEHWEVIRFLRVHFENVGASLPPAHEFSQTLDERFSDKGGLRYLYELFPDGPLNQGGLIAGITIPANASNMSFGSV
ncbi:MAG: TusE/DsrC/DsvC family sulfur relay protein, partial [Gammaproteobacteria bacterium]|nr:TusE/DsrC/DsvC family sulfur relay protein [Gammaproteobacteria bacterium]